MKFTYSIPVLALVATLAGCTTSSQVQEMIDASNQNDLTKLEEHSGSIDVLRKSSMTGLEKSKENADMLVAMQSQLKAALADLKVAQGYADAAKVLSAANTVKIADLEETVTVNKESSDLAIGDMESLDNLYEKVMLNQFQSVADSANAAIEALKANGTMASTNAPVKLDEPIEIIAPDTSVPTNDTAASVE